MAITKISVILGITAAGGAGIYISSPYWSGSTSEEYPVTQPSDNQDKVQENSKSNSLQTSEQTSPETVSKEN